MATFAKILEEQKKKLSKQNIPNVDTNIGGFPSETTSTSGTQQETFKKNVLNPYLEKQANALAEETQKNLVESVKNKANEALSFFKDKIPIDNLGSYHKEIETEFGALYANKNKTDKEKARQKELRDKLNIVKDYKDLEISSKTGKEPKRPGAKRALRLIKEDKALQGTLDKNATENLFPELKKAYSDNSDKFTLANTPQLVFAASKDLRNLTGNALTSALKELKGSPYTFLQHMGIRSEDRSGLDKFAEDLLDPSLYLGSFAKGLISSGQYKAFREAGNLSEKVLGKSKLGKMIVDFDKKILSKTGSLKADELERDALKIMRESQLKGVSQAKNILRGEALKEAAKTFVKTETELAPLTVSEVGFKGTKEGGGVKDAGNVVLNSLALGSVFGLAKLGKSYLTSDLAKAIRTSIPKGSGAIEDVIEEGIDNIKRITKMDSEELKTLLSGNKLDVSEKIAELRAQREKIISLGVERSKINEFDKQLKNLESKVDFTTEVKAPTGESKTVSSGELAKINEFQGFIQDEKKKAISNLENKKGIAEKFSAESETRRLGQEIDKLKSLEIKPVVEEVAGKRKYFVKSDKLKKLSSAYGSLANYVNNTAKEAQSSQVMDSFFKATREAFDDLPPSIRPRFKELMERLNNFYKAKNTLENLGKNGARVKEKVKMAKLVESWRKIQDATSAEGSFELLRALTQAQETMKKAVNDVLEKQIKTTTNKNKIKFLEAQKRKTNDIYDINKILSQQKEIFDGVKEAAKKKGIKLNSDNATIIKTLLSYIAKPITVTGKVATKNLGKASTMSLYDYLVDGLTSSDLTVANKQTETSEQAGSEQKTQTSKQKPLKTDYTPKFNDSMKTISLNEGSYQDNSSDSGNYNSKNELVGTKYGISAKTYEEVMGKPPTKEEMQGITKDEATKILYEGYWKDVPEYESIDNVLATNLFDSHVNHGRHGGFSILKNTLKQLGIPFTDSSFNKSIISANNAYNKGSKMFKLAFANAYKNNRIKRINKESPKDERNGLKNRTIKNFKAWKSLIRK